MSQVTPNPPLPPPSRPSQIRCFGCHGILTVIPPPGVTGFTCPLCQMKQLLPPELKPGSVKGFDPATMMQVGCYKCMSILNVPRGLTRFKCSLCFTDLVFNIPLIHPTLPLNEGFQKTNENVVMNNASSATPSIEEKPASKGLKGGREIREEIKEEVEDYCSDFHYDPNISCNTISSQSELQTLQVKDELDLLDIVADRGQVERIRGFPHPRHMCTKYPFHSTPHHIHCTSCYCCLCDTPAPCKEWFEGTLYIKHCNATAPDIKIWRGLIRNRCKRSRSESVQAYKANMRGSSLR